MSAKQSWSSSGRCLQVRLQSRDQVSVAGDGSRQQSGSQGPQQGGSAPHQEGHQLMYEFANHPAHEAADEFRARKSRFYGEEPATPPPAHEGDIGFEAGPDPSLPTTGSRGRGQPRSLVQGAGGGVASWE